MALEPKQYLFVALLKDINIGSTTGRSILFEKGKPTHVPREMHAEVMSRGVLPCDKDGKVGEVQVDPQPEADLTMAPEDAQERAEALEGAIRQVVKRNDAMDFTGGGVPSASVLSSILKWRVDQKEVRPVWARLKPLLLNSTLKE